MVLLDPGNEGGRGREGGGGRRRKKEEGEREEGGREGGVRRECRRVKSAHIKVEIRV